MRETPEDLARLQETLDRSYERAGRHLRQVITPERRVTAEELVGRLVGMRLLVLATVTADCRPLAGPVDGILYRGSLWFGSAVESVRFRHIRTRPQVSATHLEGEPFSVTVHGRAVIEGPPPDLPAGFREVCVEVYGPEWEEWGEEALYARIEAERIFTFRLDQ